MPNVFVKVNSKFIVSEVNDPENVVNQLNSPEGRGLSVTVMQEGGSSVGFDLTSESIVSGSLIAKSIGKNIEVDCQAVFKISPRPQFTDLVLDPNSKWNLSSIQFNDNDGSRNGAHPISGLEIIVENFKNRFGVDCEKRTCILPVKTALKQKDLT